MKHGQAAVGVVVDAHLGFDKVRSARGLRYLQLHGAVGDGVVVVDDTVLVELKAVREFDSVFEAQCLNYLKGTGKPICLLLNFGKPRLDVKRYRR